MSSQPGTDGESIADELAASQRQISISEFFEKNRQMLGFDSGAKALVTAVKEAVDNALDATEEVRILPDIYVEIQENDDYYTLIVEDNGPGIKREQIPKIFGKLLYGSRFGSRQQARGQQGIGISAAVLYSQLTSGKPARITSRTQDSDTAQYFELIIDTDNNNPEIKHEEEISWDRPHGTRIEMEMEGNMRARQQLHQYIRHTAVVNPHARIEFKEPSEHFKFERSTDELPKETSEIKPHPHGVELGTVQKMLKDTNSQTLSGFLQNEFTRVGRTTSDSIIDAFRDRHFGRGGAWSPPTDDTLHDVAEDAVSRKDPKATEGFATDLQTAITEQSQISYAALTELVEDTADDSEEAYDERFGETVRENARDALWEAIQDSRPDDIEALVDGATSTQKTTTTVSGIAGRITNKFADSTNPRDRITYDTLEDFVDRAANMTEDMENASVGSTARENICEAIWETMQTVPEKPPLVRELIGDRDTVSELLVAMTDVDIIAPPTDCLSPIGEENLEVGLKKVFDADFYSTSTRDADVHGGDPFIAEAAIAYGGSLSEEGQANVLRFANRVPLVYQRGGCSTTSVVKNIGWRNYKLSQSGGRGIPTGPAVILVHVASTNVPFTSESKDAIASIPEIEHEVELAIREAARDLKSHLKKQQSMRKRQRKQDTIVEILPDMAEKIGNLTGDGTPDISLSLARIMNNVLVDRTTNGDAVTVTVSNYQNQGSAVFELTEIIVDSPVSDVSTSDDASVDVVEMDGEQFIKWEPSLSNGAQETLTYTVSADAAFDISIDGIEDELVTITMED